MGKKVELRSTLGLLRTSEPRAAARYIKTPIMRYF
jgi:hypothetical protein